MSYNVILTKRNCLRFSMLYLTVKVPHVALSCGFVNVSIFQGFFHHTTRASTSALQADLLLFLIGSTTVVSSAFFFLNSQIQSGTHSHWFGGNRAEERGPLGEK